MRELDQLSRSYGDLLRHLDPAAASAAGFVSEDARLGDFGDQAVRQHVVALWATAAAGEELDVETLADEIDRTALVDDVRATTACLEQDRPHRRNPGFWLEHLADALTSLMLRGGAEPELGVRSGAVEERIAAVPAFLDSARATLTHPPLVLLDAALKELGPLGELLVRAAAQFGSEAPGGPEALNTATETALQALARFGHWLRSELAPDPGRHAAALGAERFEQRIQQRYAAPAGSTDLWRYATRLLDETDAALTAAASDIEPGRNWRELAEHLEEDHTSSGTLEEEFERMRAALTAAALKVGPGPAVELAPLHLRGMLPDISYLRGPDGSSPAMARIILTSDQLSRAELPVIAASTMAGRHLQETYARDLDREVRRQLRTPIGTDGWALYAEQWMEEVGLFTKDAQLIRLVRLLRAAGLLAVDVAIHTRAVSPTEAIQLLTDRSRFSRDAAEIAVRRIVAHPTDASAAALGRRELLRLRAAAGVDHRDPTGLQRFHTALLGFGALPPGLAGWGMGLDT